MRQLGNPMAVTFFQALSPVYRKPLIYAYFIALVFGISHPAQAGEISFQQDQFVSETFESAEQKNFSYLGAQFESAVEGTPKHGFGSDIEGRFAPGTPVMSYIDVREFYAQQAEFSIGRKKLGWSKIDTIWSLGRYEPLFKWNPLAPETQGLTGFFIQAGNDKWGFDLFASFLFIPDQGAGYELKDGSFKKSSPWFQTPPSYVRIFDQIDRVNYEINEPSMSDIVFNRSFAASVHYGQKEQGIFVQGALASKPANQLVLGLEADHTTQDVAHVQVTPKTFYHELGSGEVSYGSKLFNIGLAGLVENFRAPEFEDGIIYTQYRPSTIVSPFVELHAAGWKSTFSYLKINGGEAEVKGPLQVQKDINISEAYPFREATLLKVSKIQRLSKRRSLDLETQYIRGAGNLFSIVNLELGYRWDANWRVGLQGHLVAAADSQEADRTVAGQFQNNDTVSLGFGYVF
jgi:hypothetical protein